MTFWQSVQSWRPWRTTALLHRILIEIRVLGDKLMATEQEILDQLAAASASLDGIQADVTALKALVDSGANLDTIKAAVDALAAKAAGIDQQTQ